MRARYPDSDGFVERDGVKVGYEVFGQGEPAIVFTPIDAIVHSHAWKAQVPTWPARTRSSRSTRAATDARTARPTPPPTPTPSSSPTRSR